MSDTPRTNFVAHETGDAEWDRSINRFGRMMAHACILERENVALRLNLSVTMEELGEMRDRAEKAEAENATLREQLAASRQEVEVQKAKADKHYELGTEYFDLMVKAEREIAGLQKLLKRSATYIVDYPLSGQRDRIFLNQIDAALNKIDTVITATGEEQ